MSITAERFTISTTPVALNTATTAGQYLAVVNTSANAADLGPSTVAATEGLALAGGATVTLTIKPGDVVYAIRTTGSDATLAVLRS
jgi:hypothetical protein